MKLLRRLAYFMRQGRADADLAEELEFHRAMNMQAGGDPRAMGNLTVAREDARAVWIAPWMDGLRQDAAYALRNLRRQPGFTLVALVTLGTAIGLNTSLFTVFNLVALRTWPVRDPGRVVRVLEDGRGFSPGAYRRLAANAALVSGLAAKRDEHEHTLVSANYFRVLGVEMELGRGFREDEAAVAVLSNAYWLEHFGGDQRIVDKQIEIDGRMITIVGVASKAFTLDGNLWLPLPPGGPCCVDVLGRLAAGISAGAAQAELTRWNGRAVELAPIAAFSDKKGRMLPLFGLMFLAVTMVLVLTCANVGNLLLARAEARRAEMYVRFSLGASRGRILRQLMTESLVLALAAAAPGLAAAYELPDLVMRQFHQVAPFRIAPDAAVLVYTLAVAILCCIGFGLAPALRATRPSDGQTRMRGILLAVQVAMSVILLVGAGMLTKAVVRSRSLDPGFSVADVAVVSFAFPAGAADAARANAFYARFLGEGRALAEREPLSNRNILANGPLGWIQSQSVSPEYFAVMRIPIVAGRNLQAGDGDRHGVLVNETMARRYWGGDALGRKFKAGDHVREIVGVVKDTYSTGAGLEGIDPMLYEPFTRRRAPAKLLVRSTPGVVESIAAAAAQIDARVQVDAEPLSDSVDRWLEPARTGAAIAAMLGLFALVLATVGMSGVYGYVVQQRTKEIGIRMALGAQPAEVVRLVLGGASRAVMVGAAAGFVASAPVSRMMQHRLAGVSALDPSSYLWVAAALASAAMAASYLPARRATRIDPMSALRRE